MPMLAALPHAAAYRNPGLGAVIYLTLVAVLVGSAMVATWRGRSRRRRDRR
jgi:hypothetical protein